MYSNNNPLLKTKYNFKNSYIEVTRTLLFKNLHQYFEIENFIWDSCQIVNWNATIPRVSHKVCVLVLDIYVIINLSIASTRYSIRFVVEVARSKWFAIFFCTVPIFQWQETSFWVIILFWNKIIFIPELTSEKNKLLEKPQIFNKKKILRKSATVYSTPLVNTCSKSTTNAPKEGPCK